MAMPAMPAMAMEEMEETEMEEILLIKVTKQMAHRSMPQIFIILIWRLILWVFFFLFFPKLMAALVGINKGL